MSINDNKASKDLNKIKISQNESLDIPVICKESKDSIMCISCKEKIPVKSKEENEFNHVMIQDLKQFKWESKRLVKSKMSINDNMV